MARWAELCWNFRTRLRMTQKQAADAVGVSLATWSRWERGETTPAGDRLGAVLDNMVLEYRAIYPAPELLRA
jgi:transcriptional regulator with XRE-family HTH domain